MSCKGFIGSIVQLHSKWQVTRIKYQSLSMIVSLMIMAGSVSNFNPPCSTPTALKSTYPAMLSRNLENDLTRLENVGLFSGSSSQHWCINLYLSSIENKMSILISNSVIYYVEYIITVYPAPQTKDSMSQCSCPPPPQQFNNCMYTSPPPPPKKKKNRLMVILWLRTSGIN